MYAIHRKECQVGRRSIITPRTVLLSLLLLSLALCIPAVAQVRVRLKNGDFLAGQLVAGQADGRVAIQCPSFSSPVQLDVQAVRSIDCVDRPAAGEVGKQTFVLINGMSITGQLLDLDDQNVRVKSPVLGEVTFPRELLSEFSDTGFSGRLIYTGPRSGQDWSGGERTEDWAFEAGAIATSKAGASIVGDVNLPDKAEIRFSLSWTKSPDFVLALGCSKGQRSEQTAALRLEIWDGALAMVREVGNNADVALISDFSADENRLNLVVYLDQTNGVAAVATPLGKLLDKLELKSEKVSPQNCVKLSNHSQENYKSVLRLERFEVREWDGHLPEGKEQKVGQVLLGNGDALDGQIKNYDPTTNQLTIATKDGDQSIEVANIRRALISQSDRDKIAQAKPTELETEVALPTNPFGDKPVAEGQAQPHDAAIEVELSDHSRLTGRWLDSKSGQVAFRVAGLKNDLQFPIQRIIGFYGNSYPYAPAALSGEKCRLMTNDCELFGVLVAGDPAVLAWQTEAAAEAVGLAPDSSGKIIFTTRTTSGSSARRNTASTTRLDNLMRANPNMPRRRNLSIGLEFRTGDVIAGNVKSIDEAGVTFASENTVTRFVPHANMESVTLRSTRESVNETPQKLERLMTVPRSMKLDPPTHLIISATGDYLRGRLTSLNEQQATMEIRMESTTIPTDQIAQIFWLHDRQWEKEEQAKKPQGDMPASSESPASGDQQQTAKVATIDRPAFQVHAIRRDEGGITFAPQVLSDGKLRGNSPLLGDCEVSLSEVQTLLFGRDVGSQARALRKELWKLSLATLPKVYQEGEEGQMESASPLVGQPAPNFTLVGIDGAAYELSKFNGKVVVLDFWASWCGPCVKTMPEIDRVVKEVGGKQVELIAVNVQESKERVATAVGRLGITATVLLDVDGEVSAQYQANAIPQTVIIDRNGTVTQLFVGGGNKFVENFEAALKKALEL